MTSSKLLAEIQAKLNSANDTVVRTLVAEGHADVIGDLRKEGYFVNCEQKGGLYKIEVSIPELGTGISQLDFDMAESFCMLLNEIKKFETRPFRYVFEDFNSLSQVASRLRVKNHYVEIESRSPCDFTLVAWKSQEVYETYAKK